MTTTMMMLSAIRTLCAMVSKTGSSSCKFSAMVICPFQSHSRLSFIRVDFQNIGRISIGKGEMRAIGNWGGV